MKVFLQFDKPFFGIVFSKGHYNNMNCVYLPAGLGRASATFEIGMKVEIFIAIECIKKLQF